MSSTAYNKILGIETCYITMDANTVIFFKLYLILIATFNILTNHYSYRMQWLNLCASYYPTQVSSELYQ